MNIAVYTRDVRGESYNCKDSITMEIDFDKLTETSKVVEIVKSSNLHVWIEGEDCEDSSRGFFALWQGENDE